MGKITAINGFIKKTTGCVKRKLTPRILPNYIGNVNDASGFIFIKKNNIHKSAYTIPEWIQNIIANK